MDTKTTERPCDVRIVRTKTNYLVVPGILVTRRDCLVTFCNRAGTDMDVSLDPAGFSPSALTIPDSASDQTTVIGGPGVYDYEVRESRRPDGFYAVGNSSPRIIVDP